MLRTTILSLFTLVASSTMLMADIGFDKIIPNNSGRGWRLINRDMDDDTHWHSGASFVVTGVDGAGEQHDMLTFSLTLKEDHYRGQGWDESKTRLYTGSGLIKAKQSGRIHFEIYVDTGNGTTTTVTGYYHPGESGSDHDDRMVLNLPAAIEFADWEDPCNQSIPLTEGNVIGF